MFLEQMTIGLGLGIALGLDLGSRVRVGIRVTRGGYFLRLHTPFSIVGSDR